MHDKIHFTKCDEKQSECPYCATSYYWRFDGVAGWCGWCGLLVKNNVIDLQPKYDKDMMLYGAVQDNYQLHAKPRPVAPWKGE